MWSKGDRKPVVMVITQGSPAGSLRELAANVKRQVGMIMVFAGPKADDTLWRPLTDVVVPMRDVPPGTLLRGFRINS